MAKNSSPPLRGATLQRVVAEPITDPAEIAALDQLRQRARQKGEQLIAKDSIGLTPAEAASRLLDLSQRLPTDERSTLLMRLGASLPVDRQFDLLARVLAQLSPEVILAFEKELTTRLGVRSS